MRSRFFLTLFLFVAVCCIFSFNGKKKEGILITQLVAVSDQVQAQVDKIDADIAELERMKRGYESRARRQEDQAARLQFEDQAYLETKRHLELAEENRMKAAKIQEEIDRLQKERAKLLQS